MADRLRPYTSPSAFPNSQRVRWKGGESFRPGTAGGGGLPKLAR